MKRKIAISTIAASMAASAFAGIPLSTQGLAEKVGIQVNVASAAEALPQSFVNKVNAIHAALTAGGTAGVEDVQQLRNEIKELSDAAELNDEEVLAIIAPVWNKIEHRFNEEGESEAVQRALFRLLELVGGSYYDPNLTAISNIRDDDAIIDGLLAIERAANIDPITSGDIVGLINVLEAAAKDQVNTLLDLLPFVDENNEQARLDMIKQVVAAAKDSDNNIIRAINNLDNEAEPTQDVSVDDILEVYKNFTRALSGYENGTKALALAYLRAEADVTYTQSGLARTYSMNLLGLNVTSGLTWSSSNSSAISVNGNVLTASSSGQSATITATFRDRVLFQELVTITSSGTVTPPWTGGGGGVVAPPTDPGTETPPVDVPGVIGAVLDELDDILADLEGATPAERTEIIAKAIDAAVVAIDKIANYNAASSVTIANGVATLNASDADVLAIINGIRDIKSKLESLAPGSTNDLKPRVIAIHLGAISEDQMSVNISQALFTAARNAGLAGFEIVADRLSVTLPASTTFSGGAVNLMVERETPNGEPAVEGVRTASQIYSFDLTVGGTAVTTFDRPVILKIPVVNTDGLDEELLSLAKIVNGELEYHGGFLRGGFIVEPRDSFSSYVIVENIVNFNDIGSVSSWAGRQIQVMAAKGAIQGRAAGQFVPRDNVTRAEFAKMLISAMNLENNSATNNFSDVNAGDWFAPFVSAAADQGIINGRSATSFAPNALITRAEMATMLARTLKITHELEDVANVDGALAAFIDENSIHSTLRSGVALAASKELIIGYQGNFMPNDNATRAEAAVMVYRAFNYTE